MIGTRRRKSVKVRWSATGELVVLGAEERHEAHIYVVAFTSGTVKVGFSRNPARRIQQYVLNALIHDDPITACWVSDAHANAAANEKAMKGYCASWGELLAGQEYFRDVDFDRVQQFANSLRRDAPPPPPKPTKVADIADLIPAFAAMREEDISAKVQEEIDRETRAAQEANCRGLGAESVEAVQALFRDAPDIRSLTFGKAKEFIKRQRQRDREREASGWRPPPLVVPATLYRMRQEQGISVEGTIPHDHPCLADGGLPRWPEDDEPSTANGAPA